jgi:hypothetical protein
MAYKMQRGARVWSWQVTDLLECLCHWQATRDETMQQLRHAQCLGSTPLQLFIHMQLNQISPLNMATFSFLGVSLALPAAAIVVHNHSQSLSLCHFGTN